METIPLLRFPFLVILNVLSTMCPFELIHLSMVSKITHKVVRSFNKRFKSQYRMVPGISEDFRVIIANESHLWAIVLTNDQTKDWKSEITQPDCEYDLTKESFYKYSEDPFIEFKKLCVLVQDVFHLQIKGLYFRLDRYPDQNRLIIDWLKTRQETFEFFDVYSDIDTDTDLKYLLDHLKISISLVIFSKIKNDFQVELPENLEYLAIIDAKFVKFEQLLRMKSQGISLRISSLTSVEINRFLVSWMALECHLNLEYLSISIENEAAMATILGDIPHEVLDPADVREFDHHPTPISGGVVIRRNDGKSARIGPLQNHLGIFMRMFIY